MSLVIDDAREAARSVISEQWEPGWYPVDVERIAHAMGLKIEYTFLREGVSGMIRSRPDETPTIYVDLSDSPGRQRFTIAHELGHFVERSNQGQIDFAFIDERGDRYDLHEFYADEFAGNLLMPEHEISRLSRDGASNIELAKYFGVSVPALNKRRDRIRKANAQRGQ